MAFIDYGAVVIKNGEVINHKMFMDMEKSVGWTDKDTDTPSNTLNGNYFAFVGDEKLTLAFYKTWMVMHLHKKYYGTVWNMIVMDKTGEYCDYECNKKSMTLYIHNDELHIKKISDLVYHASIKYNGDFYHIIYGYGIDCHKKIWNDCKVKYLGKSVAKKVDKVYSKFIDNWVDPVDNNKDDED